MADRIVAGLVAGLAFIAAAAAQSPRVVGEAGDWVKVESGGLVIYRTSDNRSGSSIEIGCKEAMGLDHSATGISIEIGGKMLPPNSQLSFTIDSETIIIPTGESGGVSTRRCPECAEKFSQLWRLLRQGNSVEVTASDGTRADFSLRGTAQLMPAEACPAGS